MKKYRFLIILGIIIVIVIVLKMFTRTLIPKQISSYLIQNGYKKKDDLLSKKISILSKEEYYYYVSEKENVSYEINSFSIADFKLTKNLEDFKDGISNSLTETYDYKNNILNYTYRINSNEMNVILNGTLNGEKFTCNKEFSYGILIDNFKDSVCDKIRIQVDDFNIESKLLFKNGKFINYMSNKK